MASAILITAVLFFAVRGMFLGFSGVIGRLIGFGLGYIVAYVYRQPFAALIEHNLSSGLPPMVLQVVAGLVLFVVTMFASTLAINTLFTVIGKIIPGFHLIGDKESVGGRVAGAAANGLIAAAIVLMGVWGYGKITGHSSSDPLQQFANRFGDKVFSLVSDNADLDMSDFNIQSFSSTSVKTITHKPANSSAPVTTTSSGSAYIVSSSDPAKSLSIETIRQVIEQNSDALNGELANNQTLQSLLNNQDIRDSALQQLQQNPEQLQQLLNNPKLQQLLQQFNTAPAADTN